MARKWLVDPGQAINLRIEWGTFERWEGKQIMKSNQTFLYVGAALCALAGSMPAMAQDAASTTGNATGNDIIVTGSRIQRGGFDLPTPTTVVGEEELRLGDRPSIAQALNDIPQFRPSATPATTTGNTNAAASSADLRGLGSGRTLTLLNGHRFTGSNDLNIIPQNIVKRVDIVTGGASAAWGSGAVAGVVNIILDDDLTGWKAGLSTGISSRGDGHRYGGDLAWGTDFADGRGHFMVAGEYQDDKGAFDRKSRPNMSAGVFQRADGQLVLADDVNYTILNRGGSILSTSVVPYNLAFNPDGSVGPLPLGSETFGQLTVGGNGQHVYDYLSVSTPYERINGFARVSYEFSPALKVWAHASFNRMKADFGFFPDTPVVVVMPDNAFLTQTAKTQLAAAGVNGPFLLGRFLDDVGPDKILNYSYTRRNIETAIGLEGSFGGGWKYDIYYNHGELRNDQTLANQRITANFNKAIDAVLVNGVATCRVNADASTANDDAACKPLNLLGNGNISDAARAYAFGSGGTVSTTKLDTAGFSISGQPFSLWAGPVDIAAGGDFRWEEFVTSYVDPLSLARALTPLSFAGTNGGFNVKEFFGEINIPLLNVEGTAKLEVNGAARYSDYSTSGGIWTWKGGATLRLVNDILLRAVYSRDIRSASIAELYTGRATNLGPVNDPYRNNELVSSVTSFTGGNPALNPETSNTLTVGGSYSPGFAPGLRFSVDYYKIDIKGVIVTPTNQQVVDRCRADLPNDNLCGGVLTRGADGKIASLTRTFTNLAQYKTDGLDMEAAYRMSLGSGALNLRLLATHVFSLNLAGQELAGVVGGDTPFSTPKWRVTGMVGYEDDMLGLDGRLRYVAGGIFSRQVGPNGKTLLNNDISARAYLDLGARFKIKGGFTFYMNVNNVLDRAPPKSQYVNPNYDVIGRYYSAGVKLNF
jgi:iron complex outermembrane receptor protein